jgi:hypothetical protein
MRNSLRDSRKGDKCKRDKGTKERKKERNDFACHFYGSCAGSNITENFK